MYIPHMKRTISISIIGLFLLALSGHCSGQDDAGIVELIEYTNDSLGFRIDLPCTPEWQKPNIPRSEAVLVCETTIPIVIINSQFRTIKGSKALDDYIRKQVQVGDMPYELTGRKIDGHKARRVQLSANGQDVELWVVQAKADQLLMFSFVQPTGQNSSVVSEIIDSIRLK